MAVVQSKVWFSGGRPAVITCDTGEACGGYLMPREVLLDVIVATEANVYPMIPAGDTSRYILMGPDDMPAAARQQQGE
ncbi:MAG: hypothetical protein WD005_00775 [Haliea sp.]